MILGTMNTAQIKQELHKYIDNGDDRFFKAHSCSSNKLRQR